MERSGGAVVQRPLVHTTEGERVKIFKVECSAPVTHFPLISLSCEFNRHD